MPPWNYVTARPLKRATYHQPHLIHKRIEQARFLGCFLLTFFFSLDCTVVDIWKRCIFLPEIKMAGLLLKWLDFVLCTCKFSGRVRCESFPRICWRTLTWVHSPGWKGHITFAWRITRKRKITGPVLRAISIFFFFIENSGCRKRAYLILPFTRSLSQFPIRSSFFPTVPCIFQ